MAFKSRAMPEAPTQPDASQSSWAGLKGTARAALIQRHYAAGDLPSRLTGPGVAVSELLPLSEPERVPLWIPGVELIPRQVHRQRHRGVFGELVRQDEGILAGLPLWPRQWSASTMFAGTAKGFHIHPPYVPQPAQADPAPYFQQLFNGATAQLHPPFDREQWDLMFFPQGRVEIILSDERQGLERRIMRFWIDGDNHPGPDNAGIIIPPGVAHAFRVEGNEDLITIYGTSVTFQPVFEGRIGSSIETSELPQDWQDFLTGG